ncbi:hypothetical protein [Halobacillus faecis]|uniref:Sugar isomerase n=1 Tax=Halobacillus faecis TaxID=360184 RepID=A0A511WTW8_9BACI|nr:hypothetical protein [Halobacillus faecis]GEN54614.1 hypothetical protein HFA01_28760 [Halobacillus faecis]
MNKKKKSIYTALSSVALTVLNGLLGLIITRQIILNYGSDFNGLNSTANQFIAMLMIVEGGFTLATNVALFKPLTDQNYKKINSILSATKNIFNKIGLFFLGIGILATVVFTVVVESSLSWYIVSLTLFMTVISTCFKLMYATKYRILIQTEHREYILHFISLFTLVISQLLIIVVISVEGHMLFIRLSTMLGSIINSLMIVYVCKKNYSYMNFDIQPNYKAIKGTKDVFIQKLTGIIYTTLPIIAISTTAGTIFASVYAVYNSIFTLLKSFINAIVNAPRMGLGNLISTNSKDVVLKVFYQYQFIVINVMFTFLTSTSVLIMPFISLYTDGFSDVDYINVKLAAILVLITLFEIIHIPSGNLINMSGNFKIARKIQTFSMVTLVIMMVIGNLLIGFYGVLLAVFITAVLLAIFEVGYVHLYYFNSNIYVFMKILMTTFGASVFLVGIELLLIPNINGYVTFFLFGMLLFTINGLIILMINLIVNNQITKEVGLILYAMIEKKLPRKIKSIS